MLRLREAREAAMRHPEDPVRHAQPAGPVRIAEAVARSPVAERIAEPQATGYAPVFAVARRSVLHSNVLGHSLHPALTDITMGCWASASILDLVAGAESRRAAGLPRAAESSRPFPPPSPVPPTGRS